MSSIAKYSIIGLIAFGILVGLAEACVKGISNLYDDIFSTHEEVIEAIDRGDFSQAKYLLPDVKESELYRCSQLLIEEYLAIEDLKNAIYVFERITPNHCSTYEMQYEVLYPTADYTKAVTKALYNALIEAGEYENAWKYHALKYEDPNYAGNALDYYNYMLDVIDHLCENNMISDAQSFMDEHVIWFRQNVDRSSDAEAFSEFSYTKIRNKLQSSIDEYKIGVIE